MTSLEKINMFDLRTDWSSVQSRWVGFWERQTTDRPCIAITVPRPADMPAPSVPENIEERWMDADYLVAKIRYYFATTSFLGEAVPCMPHLMIGTTTGCGPNIAFSEGSIEIKPCMQNISEPVPWHPGPDDPWRIRVEKILAQMVDLADGRFLISCPGQYPISDLLILLRGSTGFLMDLIDNMELCLLRQKELFPLWLENQQHFKSFIDQRQNGSGTVIWTGSWSPDQVAVYQSDMSTMISKEMFERFVLPELDMMSEHYDYLWYHTCGCKRHLDSLLSRPYIRAFQYSPNPQEPPNGPAHIGFYKAVQAAGRCLDIAIDHHNLDYIVRHLRPEGLAIHTTADTTEEALQMLEDARKLSGSDCLATV